MSCAMRSATQGVAGSSWPASGADLPTCRSSAAVARTRAWQRRPKPRVSDRMIARLAATGATGSDTEPRSIATATASGRERTGSASIGCNLELYVESATAVTTTGVRSTATGTRSARSLQGRRARMAPRIQCARLPAATPEVDRRAGRGAGVSAADEALSAAADGERIPNGVRRSRAGAGPRSVVRSPSPCRSAQPTGTSGDDTILRRATAIGARDPWWRGTRRAPRDCLYAGGTAFRHRDERRGPMRMPACGHFPAIRFGRPSDDTARLHAAA